MASAAQAGSGPAGAGSHAERDEPEVVVSNYPLMVVGVMLAALMQLLDTTITLVAVPYMQTSLGASAESITWVLTSYIIASAVCMPITGWLADRIGLRRLFLWSVGGFIAASVLCGMAQNLEEMVLFRALQGVAGAFILPLSQSAMLDSTRPSRRAQIMSIWGIGAVMGPVLGPVIGGLLTENASWRWVFYVNVPIGFASLAMMAATLPQWRQRLRRFDLTGFLLIGIALTATQLMLDRGHHLDWFDSLEIWLYCGVALSCAWMAAVHISTAREPLFNRTLFRDVNLIAGFAFIFVAGIILFSTMALLPPLLQNILGYGVVETGILLAMRGIGVLMSMQVASWLMRIGVDTRVLIASGFAIAGLSLQIMQGWTLEIEAWHVAVPGLVQGLGIGLVFIPLNTTAFATLPPHLRTEGSSLLNLFRSIGSSLGIAVLTAFIAYNLQASHADLGAHLTSNSSELIDLSMLDRFGELGASVLGMADAEINRQAALIAYLNDFSVMKWLAYAAAPLVFLMRRPPDLRRGS